MNEWLFNDFANTPTFGQRVLVYVESGDYKFVSTGVITYNENKGMLMVCVDAGGTYSMLEVILWMPEPKITKQLLEAARNIKDF